MKALLLIDWEPNKGCYLAEQIKNAGVDCDIMGLDFKLSQWTPFKKVMFHWTGCIRIALMAFRSRHQYEYVIAWQQIIGMFYGFLKWISRSTRPKLFIMKIDLIKRRNPLSSWIRNIYTQMVWKGSDVIGFYSHEHRDLLTREYRIPFVKTVILPFAINLNKFYYHGTLDLESYIFTVGISYRDYETLFKAAEQVDVPFVVVTQPFALKGLKVPENVKVYSNTFGSQASELMKKASVVVVPMLDPESPAGNTTLFEAMWYGKPTIVTRAITTNEYIQDGKNGFLVPCRNAEAIVTKLKYIYDHPDIAHCVGQNAKNTVLKKYSVKVQAENIVKSITQNL